MQNVSNLVRRERARAIHPRATLMGGLGRYSRDAAPAYS